MEAPIYVGQLLGFRRYPGACLTGLGELMLTFVGKAIWVDLLDGRLAIVWDRFASAIAFYPMFSGVPQWSLAAQAISSRSICQVHAPQCMNSGGMHLSALGCNSEMREVLSERYLLGSSTNVPAIR